MFKNGSFIIIFINNLIKPIQSIPFWNCSLTSHYVEYIGETSWDQWYDIFE